MLFQVRKNAGCPKDSGLPPRSASSYGAAVRKFLGLMMLYPFLANLDRRLTRKAYSLFRLLSYYNKIATATFTLFLRKPNVQYSYIFVLKKERTKILLLLSVDKVVHGVRNISSPFYSRRRPHQEPPQEPRHRGRGFLDVIGWL